MSAHITVSQQVTDVREDGLFLRPFHNDLHHCPVELCDHLPVSALL